MTISFRCPQCQSPCTAPPEMAGRKAKCLACAQVIVIPNPERDRWPPGMEPPGAKQTPAPAAPQQTTPPKRPPAPQLARPATAKPAAGQSGAGSPPRAQPVVKQVAPVQSLNAAPVIIVQPQAPAIPVAKAVPSVPTGTPAQRPVLKPGIRPVAETVSEDLDALLEFEMASPALPSSAARESNPYAAPTAQAGPPLTGKPLPIGESLREAWQVYRANLVSCVAGLAVGGAVLCGVWGATLVAIQIYLSLTRGTLLTLGSLLFWPILIVFPAWIGAGVFKLAIDAVRGRGARVDAIFAGRKHLLPVLLTGFVQLLFFALAVAVAIAFKTDWLGLPLLLPGVLFWHAPFLAIDRNLGAFAALYESIRLTVTNLPRLTLVWLVALAIASPIVVLTCGLGSLFLTPYLLVLHAVTYARMTDRS